MTEYQQHHVFSRFMNSVKEYLSAKGFSEAVIAIIIFHMWIFITATVHEAGHVFVAKYYGCDAGLAQLFGYSASSGVDCPDGTPNDIWVKIAYAGSMAAFLLGLYLWFLEPDGYARMGGLVAFLFSTLPNIAFWLPGSDAYKVVHEYGYSIFHAFLIYAIIGSYIAFVLKKEIDDRWRLLRNE